MTNLSDVQNIWFQQDGAICNAAREIINILKQKFNNQILVRRGNFTWPAKSCELTHLDFLKELVYFNDPEKIAELN